MGDIADAMMDGTLCVDCGAYLGAEGEYPQKCGSCDPRKEIEERRMVSTKRDLLRKGCKVEAGPDKKSYAVEFLNGKRFNFWPYSGWFAGPVSGRGFRNLVKAGR